jgi:lambda family phage tail tape measure protein
MGDLATLAIKLEAQSATFDRQLKESGRQLRRLEQQTKSSAGGFETLAKSARLFVGVLSAGALANFARQQTANSRSLLETSDLLRLNTDLLQGLQFAAREAGQSAEVMNTSLQRLIRRADDAKRGVPEAVRIFEDLGISIESLRESTSEEVILRFADAIQQATREGTDLSYLAKALDTEGVRVGVAFRQGSEGVLAFSREAQRAGNVIEKETLVQLSALQVQLDVIGKASQNLASGVLSGTLDLIGKAWQGTGIALGTVSRELGEFFGKYGGPTNGERLSQGFFAVADAMRDVREAAYSLTAEGASADRALRERIDLTESYSSALGELDQSLKQTGESAGAYARRVENEADQFVRGLQLSEQRKRYAAEQRSLEAGDTFKTQLTSQARTIEDTFLTTNELVLGSTVTTASGMADAFAQFAATGKLSMKDFARSVSADLLRVLSLQTLVRGFARIGGALGIPSFADGAAFQGGRVVPFASGGILDRPTYFGLSGGRTGLMGEAGPEAIMPLARGPGGKLGVRATGGGGVFAPSINVTVSAPAGGEREGRAFGQGAGVEINRALRGAFQAYLRDESRAGGLLRPAA